MGKYAIVGDDGGVVNVIVWDGSTTYPMPGNRRAYGLSRNDRAEPGGRRRNDGTWEPRPEE